MDLALRATVSCVPSGSRIRVYGAKRSTAESNERWRGMQAREGLFMQGCPQRES